MHQQQKDIDNLSNSTDKLSNSTKNSSKSIIDNNSAMDIAKHINRWFSRSNKKCC
jgi:hypothetical protein